MEYRKIEEITNEDVGAEYFLLAQVRGIRQTTGPTVFDLKDNTGSIKATGFSRAGERAFPEINIGMNIQAKVQVKERNHNIELEIVNFEKINQEIIEKPNYDKRKFLINSERLENMKPLFVGAAKIIYEAVQSSRPIVLRHHDDPDGYTCGIVLEKAIKPLVEEVNPEKPYLFFTRSSSRTPFYDYIDAMRDLDGYLSGKKRYNEQPPLIILTDLGSNSQSIRSIKRLHEHGCDFIIIDHHHFDEENKNICKVFLNPHVFDYGSDMNAGALCTELALMLDPRLLQSVRHLPALSGTSDRSLCPEFDEYLKISGYEKETLARWARAIDHDLYYLKFNESVELLEDLFFPSDKMKKFVDETLDMVERSFSNVSMAAKKYVSITDYNNFKVLRVGRYSVAYGDYAGSKLPRIAHDLAEGARITMIDGDESISFRADGVDDFSVIGIIDLLKEKMPYGIIDGGGHSFAGTLRFAPAAKEEVMRYVHEYIKNIDEKSSKKNN